MTEKPLAGQDLALVSLPGRTADGHSAAPVTVSHAMPHTKPAAKQPRFAITGVKLLEALRHRWKLALLVGLILGGLGVALACLTYQPKYTATAYMRMQSAAKVLLPRNAGYNGEQREEEFRKTLTFWMKSPAVLSVVVKKPSIYRLAVIRDAEFPDAWLEKELKAISVPGTDWFKISLSGQNPREVTEIVNTVKDEFIEQFVEQSDTSQHERSQRIEKALVAEQAKIKERQNTLKRLVEQSGSGDPQVLNLKQKAVLEEYGLVNRQLLNLTVEILNYEALLTVQSAGKDKDFEKVETVLIEEVLERLPRVESEQGEIANIEKRIAAARKKLSDDSPFLLKLREDLQQAKKNLAVAKLELQPEAKKKAAELLERRNEADKRTTALRLKILKEQRDILKNEVKSLYDKAEGIGKGSLEIELLRAELSEADNLAKALRNEKEHLTLELANDEGIFSKQGKIKSFVHMNQKAEIPTYNEASLLKTGSLYGIAGLLLGVFGISYFEARSRRLHTPSDVHQELGIKTLGMLPLLAQKDGRAYGLSAKDSPPGVMFTEAVNSLCASLLCDECLSRGAVLMVTSAGENEGKTVLATQLAAGLAHTGRRTLLLDADLRNSRCREQLNLPAGPGLSEVLRGEAELNDALQTIPESEARVLTAGQSDAHVIRALSNGDFAALLARLRQQFDCIIIDSAPTLVVADGLLIGKLADGVILVVRPKVSKAPAVFTAYEQLTSLHIRTLGAVVNANPLRSSSTYYAHY